MMDLMLTLPKLFLTADPKLYEIKLQQRGASHTASKQMYIAKELAVSMVFILSVRKYDEGEWYELISTLSTCNRNSVELLFIIYNLRKRFKTEQHVQDMEEIICETAVICPVNHIRHKFSNRLVTHCNYLKEIEDNKAKVSFLHNELKIKQPTIQKKTSPVVSDPMFEDDVENVSLHSIFHEESEEYTSAIEKMVNEEFPSTDVDLQKLINSYQKYEVDFNDYNTLIIQAIKSGVSYKKTIRNNTLTHNDDEIAAIILCYLRSPNKEAAAKCSRTQVKEIGDRIVERTKHLIPIEQLASDYYREINEYGFDFLFARLKNDKNLVLLPEYFVQVSLYSQAYSLEQEMKARRIHGLFDLQRTADSLDHIMKLEDVDVLCMLNMWGFNFYVNGGFSIVNFFMRNLLTKKKMGLRDRMCHRLMTVQNLDFLNRDLYGNIGYFNFVKTTSVILNVKKNGILALPEPTRKSTLKYFRSQESTLVNKKILARYPEALDIRDVFGDYPISFVLRRRSVIACKINLSLLMTETNRKWVDDITNRSIMHLFVLYQPQPWLIEGALAALDPHDEERHVLDYVRGFNALHYWSISLVEPLYEDVKLLFLLELFTPKGAASLTADGLSVVHVHLDHYGEIDYGLMQILFSKYPFIKFCARGGPHIDTPFMHVLRTAKGILNNLEYIYIQGIGVYHSAVDDEHIKQSQQPHCTKFLGKIAEKQRPILTEVDPDGDTPVVWVMKVSDKLVGSLLFLVFLGNGVDDFMSIKDKNGIYPIFILLHTQRNAFEDEYAKDVISVLMKRPVDNNAQKQLEYSTYMGNLYGLCKRNEEHRKSVFCKHIYKECDKIKCA